MPWRYVFEPNPSDTGIPVLKELPEGYSETKGWGEYKVAGYPLDKLIKEAKEGRTADYKSFYQCRYCDGWIEGKAYEYFEDDIGPLCGRRGTVSACIRCGNEIGFSGMVS
jgi:hypothetical protein